jgi:hypothetical protein
MSFDRYQLRKKVAVSCKAIEKHRMAAVTRDYGSTQAFCLGVVRKTREASRKGLGSCKRRPEFERNPGNKEMEKPTERSNPNKEESKPAKCPYNGFERICKKK